MSNDDDLLERARALQQRAADAEDDARRRPTNTGTLHRIGEFFATLNRYLGPIGRALAWIVGIIARWFRWAAYFPPRDETDEPVFSWTRLSFNTLLTFIAVVGLHVTWSAIYFYSTYFEEMVYVTGKQEIETGELYQFGGCTSLPCSTESDNGKFYLIESSLYFPVMFYPEENVFANIPQQNGACRIEGYGIYFRALRWLYKSAQLYQHVVNVSCRPYTEDEIRRAVSEGDIVRDEATP